MLIEGEIGEVLVEGEISNWRPASSGHCYFALKDEQAMIQAVMFKSDFVRLKFKPKDGMKVEIEGRLSVYEARGQYQIVVSKMREAGLGELFRKFHELKEKLAKEGLFDPAKKKPLPFLPQKIGVVTSPTGAAIRDILNIITRRFSNLEVIIYPVKVQGEWAAGEIAYAIRRFNELKLVEVIIMGRGGGSIEDLWAFNEEIVARAIYDSEIPIISAVGHEIDFTIADFVADLRAPTPSAAAELVVKNSEDLLNILKNYSKRLSWLLKNKIDLVKSRLEKIISSWAFRKPQDRLLQFQQNLDDLTMRLDHSIAAVFERANQKYIHLSSHLNALNPESILLRGFSIVYHKEEKSIIKSPEQVKDKDPISVQTAKGFFDANVVKP